MKLTVTETNGSIRLAAHWNEACKFLPIFVFSRDRIASNRYFTQIHTTLHKSPNLRGPGWVSK